MEKEDQCMSCKNFKKGVECPLLQALGFGLVNLEGVMYVTNCGFYEEHKRHLELVKEDKINLDLNDKNE